jgi:hypothetical protein
MLRNQLRSFIIVIVILLTAIISCKKSSNVITNAAPSNPCKLLSWTITSQTGTKDSMLFSYTSDGHLSVETMIYNGFTSSVSHYHYSGSRLQFIDNSDDTIYFYYDQLNRIDSTIEHNWNNKVKFNWNRQGADVEVTRYFYNAAGRVNQYVIWEKDAYGGVSIDSVFETYTGNNITSETVKSKYGSGSWTSNKLIITYDNMKNFYSAFMDYTGLSFIGSENNMTSIKVADSLNPYWTRNYLHYNTRGYPTEYIESFSFQGSTPTDNVMTYQCP